MRAIYTDRVTEAGGGPAMRHERNARRDQEHSDADARVADENASGIPMERAVRATTAAVGAASLAVGAVAVFQTQNGAGSAALLVIGAALLVLAGVGRWPKRMTFGDTSIEFPGGEVTSIAAGVEEHGDLRGASELYKLVAREAEERGNWTTASQLKNEAASLDEQARRIASDYEKIRGSTTPSASRTRTLEGLMVAAREAARESKFDKDQIRKFMEGGDGDRIFALGVMQEDPDVRDFELVVQGISNSRSAFEQYHALLLAQKMLADLNEAQQHELGNVIEKERRPGGYIVPGSDRWALSEEILARIRGG
jgi:hypothetical protein